MTTELIIIVASCTIAVILIFLLVKKVKAHKITTAELVQTQADFDNFKEQFKDIIDIRKELTNRQLDLSNLQQQFDDLTLEFNKQKEQLNSDFHTNCSVYEKLLSEILTIEENLEIISYGMYKAHYDFQSTEEYKIKLDEIRERQKLIIKEDKATFCPTTWTVGGSEAKGRQMVKEASKLMLRAFNGECDATVAKVNWGNISNMEDRIQKAPESINKLGSTNQILT